MIMLSFMFESLATVYLCRWGNTNNILKTSSHHGAFRLRRLTSPIRATKKRNNSWESKLSRKMARPPFHHSSSLGRNGSGYDGCVLHNTKHLYFMSLLYNDLYWIQVSLLHIKWKTKTIWIKNKFFLFDFKYYFVGKILFYPNLKKCSYKYILIKFW